MKQKICIMPLNDTTGMSNGLTSPANQRIQCSRMLNFYAKLFFVFHLLNLFLSCSVQAKQDTKFFYVLTTLLNETSRYFFYQKAYYVLKSTQAHLHFLRYRAEESNMKENIREVYSWYLGNKQSLSSRPVWPPPWHKHMFYVFIFRLLLNCLEIWKARKTFQEGTSCGAFFVCC